MSPIVCPLAQYASRYPDHAALIAGSRLVTFAELNSFVERAAVVLRARGVGAGSRVALPGKATPEYLVALWALWRLGATAVPLSPSLPDRAFAGIIREHHVTSILSDSCRTDDVIGVSFWSYQSLNPAGDDWPRRQGLPELSLDQPATIILTSGSSGSPKAAVQTLGNHYFSALGANQHIPLNEGDRWLLSLPMHHVSGLGVVMRCALAGAAVVIPTGEGLSFDMENFSVTHVSLVAAQLSRLMADDKWRAVLKTLKAILLGGSAIPANLTAQAIDLGLPLYVSYGLTEMASQVATSRRLSRKDQGASPGAVVLPFRQLKVADDGEILVRGETLFSGYDHNGRVENALLDGWFPTGDLGELDSDGLLRVRGRKDNMFISGGENIYPEEIERRLLELAGIECAVVVPCEDQKFGQRPAAFIKFALGTAKSGSELARHLNSTLEPFKIPDVFYGWPVEERATGIKTDRRYLLEILRNRQALPLSP